MEGVYLHLDVRREELGVGVVVAVVAGGWMVA